MHMDMEKEPCNNQINISKYIIFKIYPCHTLGDLYVPYIYQFSLSIFIYLLIILLQNVYNQINNIYLPEADRVNTV